MIRLFIEGGVIWMSIMTIELIAVLVAAWKAPGWVKEAGIIALVTGILGFLFGFHDIAESVRQAGGVSMVLIFIGLKIASLTVIYGCLIYLLSLIIRIVQKPKLL